MCFRVTVITFHVFQLSVTVLLELNCPAIVMRTNSKGGASSPFVPSGSFFEEIHVVVNPVSKVTVRLLG
jgi:hypothetical protein